MFGFQKKKCTMETRGTIVETLVSQGICYVTYEYVVNGKTYKKREQVKMGVAPLVTEDNKKGFQFSTGLESLEKGSRVRIMVNPDKPEKAFLPDNGGKN